MKSKLILFCLLLLLSQGMKAQQFITLKPDRILDGRGGIIEGKNVIVEGNRIVEISTAVKGTVVSLKGQTLMPGGIDTHVHLDWHFDPDGKFHDAKPGEESPAQRVLFNAENGYLDLMSGFTTVQSLGAAAEADYRDAVKRGVLPGPRVITSMGSIGQWTGPEDSIRRAVNRFADEGADVIKIFASAGLRVGGNPTMSQSQLEVACTEARKRGLRTVVHAHGPESAKRAVLAGATAIEHGVFFDEETLRLMAEHGTYYDPHIYLVFNNYFANRERYIGVGDFTEAGFKQMEPAIPMATEVFRKALKVPGLKIVFGTDAVAGAHGHNMEELFARVEKGGQPPIDALVSMQSLAAASLGLEKEIGVVAPGMNADLIAVPGNPVKNIRSMENVSFVMKDGRIVKKSD